MAKKEDKATARRRANQSRKKGQARKGSSKDKLTGLLEEIEDSFGRLKTAASSGDEDLKDTILDEINSLADEADGVLRSDPDNAELDDIADSIFGVMEDANEGNFSSDDMEEDHVAEGGLSAGEEWDKQLSDLRQTARGVAKKFEAGSLKEAKAMLDDARGAYDELLSSAKNVDPEIVESLETHLGELDQLVRVSSKIDKETDPEERADLYLKQMEIAHGLGLENTSDDAFDSLIEISDEHEDNDYIQGLVDDAEVIAEKDLGFTLKGTSEDYLSDEAMESDFDKHEKAAPHDKPKKKKAKSKTKKVDPKVKKLKAIAASGGGMPSLQKGKKGGMYYETPSGKRVYVKK